MLFQASVVVVKVSVELTEFPWDKVEGSVMFRVTSVTGLLIWYTASETIVRPAIRMHHVGKLKHLEGPLEFSRMSQYDISNTSVRVLIVSIYSRSLLEYEHCVGASGASTGIAHRASRDGFGCGWTRRRPCFGPANR